MWEECVLWQVIATKKEGESDAGFHRVVSTSSEGSIVQFVQQSGAPPPSWDHEGGRTQFAESQQYFNPPLMRSPVSASVNFLPAITQTQT